MDRYFFINLWSGKDYDDDSGTLLPNEEAARAFAQRIIRELKEAGDYDDPVLIMVVKNNAGQQLFSIAF